ncbi:MAG: MFS transporter, partial [Gemmatimonadales bacterium]
MKTGRIRLKSPEGRWTIAASVLGSGAVFLESTVVNVALPGMARNLGTGMAGLQWVVNGYLLSLSALMLLGGSLGDFLSRRRVFAWGLIGFAVSTALCAVAPGLVVLVILRVLQGAAGALLVPNSLALLEEMFVEEDRGTAIGQWAGWSAVSTAAGPLFGGWLVDAGNWRWVFASVVPFALMAAWIALRRMPEGSMRTRDESSSLLRDLDIAGAALATLGLGGLIGALISGPGRGFTDPLILILLIGGTILLAGFVAVERRARFPLLPLDIFRIRQFSGANLVTFFVYAALGGVFFLLMIQLQSVLGYSALAAGASLLPINALLLLFSPLAGRLSGRYGPRWPMTLGAAVAGAGVLMLAMVRPGAGYVGTVLPGVLVFGAGLAAFVAPITAAVLGAVPDRQTGV